MDLIEKAAEKLRLRDGPKESLEEKVARKLDVAGQNATNSAADEMRTSSADMVASSTKLRKGRIQFEPRVSRFVPIDWERLAEQGYVSPGSHSGILTEEFRIVKRRLLLRAFAKGQNVAPNSNVIMVTSSCPGEGKTFCSINLALSIAAEREITVLLVDGDVSRPQIPNVLGINPGKGLVDLVMDEDLDIPECMLRTDIESLSILPAGTADNLSAELLASERMENLVKEISERYPDRLIIIDSPPVLASSIPSIFALFVGQVLFVIEADQTREPQIREALSLISVCPNITLLLNKTRFNGGTGKFGYYYGAKPS